MFISSFRCCLFSAFIFGSYHISSNTVITNLTQMVVNLPSDERYEMNSQVESDVKIVIYSMVIFIALLFEQFTAEEKCGRKHFFFY